MSMHLKYSVATIGILVTLAGCTLQQDQVRRGNVEVEAMSSPGFEFYDIEVTHAGSDYTINGLIRHDHLNAQVSDHPGHVHISVIGADGNAVAWAAVPYRQSHPHSAYFRFSASVRTMQDAIVRLEQHAGHYHQQGCEGGIG